MPTLAELRAALGPDAEGVTDTELYQVASAAYAPLYSSPEATRRHLVGDTGKWGNRLSASIDRYQANLYGVGEALGSDWAGRQRRRNEEQADLSSHLAREQGAISSFRDVGGVGDFLDYAGGLAVDSAPYLGEALIGGLTGGSSVAARLGLGGLSRATRGTIGAVAASYPSSVGDVLSNQREESGRMNLGAAAALGAPYAALNAFGIEGALARGGLARSGIKALDNMSGWRGAAARTGVSATRNLLSEGVSETGQEVVNQLGRMAVNPSATLTDPQALERYGESFVGGATLGGLFGGLGGGWRRSEGWARPEPRPQQSPDGSTDLLGIPTPEWTLERGFEPQAPSVPATLSPLGDVTPEWTLALGLEPRARDGVDAAGMYPAVDEPPLWTTSGRRQPAPLSEMPGVDLQPLVGDEGGAVATNGRDADALYGRDNGDPGLALARQRYLDELRARQEAQARQRETAAAVQQKAQDRAALRARAKEATGVDSTKAADLFGDLERQRDAGLLSDDDFVSDAALISTSEFGKITKNIKARDAAARAAQETTSATNVAGDVRPGADLAGRGNGGQRVLPGQPVALQPDARTAADQTVAGVEPDGVRPRGAGDTAAVAEAAPPAVDPISVLRDLQGDDQWLAHSWLGIEFDAGGQMQLLDKSAPLEALAAALPNTKRGQVGMTRQAAHKRLKAILAAAGLPTDAPPAAIRQRLTLALAGTTAEDMARNVDTPVTDADAETRGETDGELGWGADTTDVDEGAPRVDESEIDTRTPENALEQSRGRKTVNDYLKRALAEGSIQPIDIEDAAAEYDALVDPDEGDVPFAELPASLQAELVTAYVARYENMRRGQPKRLAEQRYARTQMEVLDEGRRRGRADTRGAGGSSTTETPQSAVQEVRAGDQQDRQASQGSAGVEAAPGDVGRAAEDLNSAEPKLSTDTGGNSTVESVRTELASTGLNLKSGRLTIVQAISELPKHIQRSVEKAGAVPQAFVLGGRAYLIAGNIRPGNARSVLMHEVGVHLGLENLLTAKEFGRLANKVVQWADANDASLESRVARRAIARAGAAKTADHQLHSEIVAYFVEEAVRADVNPTALNYASEIGRWMASLLRTMKEALRKLGLIDAAGLTAQDVVDLAYGAAHLELNSDSRLDAGEVALSGSDTPRQALQWTKFTTTAGQAYAAPTFVLEPVGTITQDEFGPKGFVAASLLGHASRVVPNTTTREFQIVDNSGRRVGSLVSDVDSGGNIVSIHNIEVAGKKRGLGAQVVAALAANAPNGLKIQDIVHAAEGFWNKLGVGYIDVNGDSTLDWEGAQRYLAQRQGGVASTDHGAPDVEGDVGVPAGEARELEGWPDDVEPPKFSIADPAAAGQLNQARQAAARAVPPQARDAWTNARDAFKKHAPYFLTSGQIAEQFGTKIQELREAVRLSDLMRVETNTQQMEFDAVVKRWAALPKDVTQRLNEVTQQATLQQIHPDRAFDAAGNEHLTPEQRPVHAALRAKYLALGSEGQAVYQAALKTLESSRTRMIDVARTLQEAYGVKSSVPGKVQGPYFPLMRFGEYLAVGESEQFKALADELAQTPPGEQRTKLRERLEAMKRDPRHYVVSAHETRAQMESAVAALRGSGLDARPSMANQRLNTLPRDVHSLVHDMAKRMADSFDGETANEVIDAYTEILMRALPEMHAMHRQAERVGVQGASADMMRAVAAAGRQNAYYTARMMYAKPLAETMLEMKAKVKGDVDLMHVHREMERRHALNLQFHDTPVQDALGRMGTLWFLAASPTYLLMNGAQTWLVTAPVLGAKYGLPQATKELARASREALAVLKDARWKNGKWSPWEGIHEGSIPGKSVDEARKALRELMRRGVVDEGLQSEMAAFAEGRTGGLTKFMRGMGWFAQQIELVNRVSTALATFRLARHAGLSYEEAVEEAYKVTVQTQVDYGQENTARFMRTGGGVPLAKLVFQFRRFQQAMLYLLGSNIKKLNNPAERRVATRTLGLLSVTMGMSAGVLGLPFMGTALAVANAFRDDDDEDGDAETALRNALFDLTGDKNTATLLAKGLPAMFGADLSKRVGMGDIGSPFPRLDMSGRTGREKVGALATAALGPVIGGLGSQFMDAAELFSQGDFAKAVERATPKVMSDVLRAARMSTGGLTDRKGDQILSPEELGAWNVFLRAMGASSTTESNYYEGTRALKDTSQAVQDRKSRIANRFRAALRDGDMADVRKQIDAFNEDHPRLRITAKDEVTWRRAQQRSSAARDATGIKVSNQRDRELEPVLRFAR